MTETPTDLSNVLFLKVSLPLKFTAEYEGDKLFGPVVRGLWGIIPEEYVQKDHIMRLLPLFNLQKELFLYSVKVCVIHRTMKDVLFEARDARFCGYFGASKTLARLTDLLWMHKAQEVSRY